MLKLLLIRHAESVGNQQQRMQGWRDDELSEVGRQQATTLALRLQREDWHPFAIYSSPLKRAAQTADLLRSLLASHGSSPTIDYRDELKEFHNGIFQGLTWAEATSRYPDLCQSLERSPDWIPIPQAETLQQIRDRACSFIQMLLAQHRNEQQIWVVTHEWILQHLVAELLGCDRSWQFAVHHTALFEFWIDRSRWHCANHNRFNTTLWQIRRFNDYSHL